MGGWIFVELKRTLQVKSDSNQFVSSSLPESISTGKNGFL